MADEHDLFDNPEENDSAIEKALRSASLLELSGSISVDLNFIRDLKSIYRLTRFSIDIDTCVLFLFVNGLWWEAKKIIQHYKFDELCTWEKVDKDQISVIETLFDIQQEIATNHRESNEESSDLHQFLSQTNLHFERFKTVRGGVAFKPSGDNVYSQYDQVFLSHIAVIISFCIDKEISSNYLKDAYQDLEKIAARLTKVNTPIDMSPTLYMDSNFGLFNKLGFLKIVENIVKTKQHNSYIIVFLSKRQVISLNYWMKK